MSRESETFFRTTGYLVARKILDNYSCQQLVQHTLYEEYPANLTTLDSAGRRTRLEGITESLNLFRLANFDLFRDAVSDLLGCDWVIILNRHNHVTIDYGDGLRSKRLHRDSLNWSRTFLTAVLPLQIPSLLLSYPRLIPSSHTWPIGAPANGGGYWLDEDEMQNLGEQAVSVEVKAGDAIFLDPLVFHGAGSGTKSKARVVLTLALRSVDELAMGVAANELLVGGAHHYAGQEEWMRTYG